MENPARVSSVTSYNACTAITYGYDGNGNMTSETRCGGVNSYEYNVENRLERIDSPSGSVTFTYDYDGNLVEKKSASVTIHYVYGMGLAPLAEINVGTRLEKDYICAAGKVYGVMETAGNTYFHHDDLGSVVALSGASGEVTDTWEYDPFGRVLNHQGTNTDNDYLFVGGYGVRRLTDKLDVMGVRQYNSQLGRFTTQDPMGFASGDPNFYRYVGNQPLRFIDPWGLQPSRPNEGCCPSGKTWKPDPKCVKEAGLAFREQRKQCESWVRTKLFLCSLMVWSEKAADKCADDVIGAKDECVGKATDAQEQAIANCPKVCL